MVLPPKLVSDARAAADVLLQDYLRIEKARKLNPLKPLDFLAIVDRVALRMRDVVTPTEDAALKRAQEVLDVKWADLSKERQARVVEAAQRALASIPQKAVPRLNGVFDVESGTIVKDTRKAAVGQYRLRIGTDTARTDQRVATFVTRSQANFITDEYGVRRVGFGNRAKEIAERGNELGLSSADITDRMLKELPAAALGRGRGYFEVVAMSFANRARTTTQLFTFDEAGIEEFEFDAVLDEATSDVCRFMHGRRFAVSNALGRYEQVEEEDDPEAVKDLQPWVRVGKDDDGNDQLYIERRDGKQQRVARVAESGVGRRDARGRFEGGMDSDRLAAAGVMQPPLHGRCRSTIQPVV